MGKGVGIGSIIALPGIELIPYVCVVVHSEGEMGSEFTYTLRMYR